MRNMWWTWPGRSKSPWLPGRWLTPRQRRGDDDNNKCCQTSTTQGSREAVSYTHLRAHETSAHL
eukprot:14030018-Alexandrium_andersonii.AAC.1